MLWAMPLRSLFLDLNSYFASCEQLLHPELRGKPVAVVPMLADTTCCLAASYEAKAVGVKTGTRVGDARRMCPGIVLVTGRHEDYIRIHHEIIAAVDTVIPVHKVCSVDEMECRLLGKEREPERAIEIAKCVKAAIRVRVAGGAAGVLTCSIGLAPNRVLAKVASDMQKPDGLVVLREEELPHRLASLTLRDMPGIGPKMEIRLKDRGVRTMADLIDRSAEELINIFGSVHGDYWWHWLRGFDNEPRETGTHSVGHQHVLPPKHRNLADARAILIRLLHKAAARMRAKGMVSPTVSVFGIVATCDMTARTSLWKCPGYLGKISNETFKKHKPYDSIHHIAHLHRTRRQEYQEITGTRPPVLPACGQVRRENQKPVLDGWPLRRSAHSGSGKRKPDSCRADQISVARQC
jgi:DNA polymerase-4